MIDQLKQVLSRVHSLASSDFAGIGLLLCTSDEDLPIYPLRPGGQIPPCPDLVQCLVGISSAQSEFHDGFHIVSTDWKLLKVSQYFSPPIIPAAQIDWSKKFGGRYLAALFGSCLPPVVAAGIASNGFGLAIFQNGHEVYFERSR